MCVINRERERGSMSDQQRVCVCDQQRERQDSSGERAGCPHPRPARSVEGEGDTGDGRLGEWMDDGLID